MVIGTVFREQVVIHGEALGYFGRLHVLPDKDIVDGQVLSFVQLDGAGKVVPAACRDELLAVRGGLKVIEVLLLNVKVRDDGGMHAAGQGVFAPCLVVGLNIDALEAVPRCQVEIARRAVVFGRVAGGHHDPPLGHLVAAEHFVLQELQHGGRERFGHAVDFVKEQDALGVPRLLDRVVHGGDDFAHGVLGYVVRFAAVLLLHDERQAQRALARVVRHGVGHEPHVKLLGYLLDDGGFADARRAKQENGTLALGRQGVAAELIFCEIRLHGVLDLLFGLFDIHGGSLSVAWRGALCQVRLLF